MIFPSYRVMVPPSRSAWIQRTGHQSVMPKIALPSIPNRYEMESHQIEAFNTLITVSSLNGPEGKDNRKCMSKLMSDGRQDWEGKQFTCT